MERRGQPRKRARQGGSLLFLIAIGVMVAGAGVAGLHYRNQLWDDHGHPDHVATTPEPTTFALPVTLTNADELAPASAIILAPPEKEETKPDAAAPPPRPTQPKAKAWVPPKKPTPKKEETPSSESDMFSKPE